MARPALTVIGLDSATFDVVDPLVEGGHLPHLARLLERGASGVLRSTTHPLTPHAWSTMVTGVNAGRHGIWDFTERDATGYGLRLINGSYRRAPALWDRLAAAGRRAGVVNVPFSWPAPELDGGFAIAGMDASFREQGMTAPASLYAELRERFGPLELDHSYPLRNGRIDLDLVRRAAEQKVQAALWLAERFEPELLFVVFMAADHVQHLGWREWEERGAESAVAGTYRILDEAVGALVEHADGGDVLVVSDHGAGRARRRRQPQRLARPRGLPHLRGRRRAARRAALREGVPAAQAAAEAPPLARSRTAPPGCARRSTSSEPATR